MKCSIETISLFIDGELPEPGQQALAVHLNDCRDCQDRLHRLEAIGRYVAAVPPEEVPADLFSQIMAGVEGCTPQTANSFRRQRVLVGLLSFVLAATGFFLAAIPILVLTMPADQSNTTSQTVDGTLSIVEQVVNDPAAISEVLFEGLASLHDLDSAINGLPILGVTLLLSALVLFLFQLSGPKPNIPACPKPAA